MQRYLLVIPKLIGLVLILCTIHSGLLGATRKRRATRVRAAAVRRRPVLKRASFTAFRNPFSPATIIRGGPWAEPTYADSTAGDLVEGEDPEVRRAAVEALGDYNGTVVVVEPKTGRILTIVNQKAALSSGFQPCSTIKVSVALAALNEKLVEPASKVRLYGRTRMDLTQALAHSNNFYFAMLGNKLGFEKFSYYAHQFGYGEKAGLNISGEQAGSFPSRPPKNGGLAMLSSFGEEIQQTPLQLAALMSAVANGGDLFYLQYPRSQQEVAEFTPKLKRHLEIGRLIGEIKPGLQAAVLNGTARRAQSDEPIAGKTGTCTDGQARTHLGWFGAYNEIGNRRLVVVTLLTGGRPAIGPAAAGVAGEVYRLLAQKNYIVRAPNQGVTVPPALISTQVCCTR